MKHTLQSLLITTVLTLPTVLGGTLDLSGDSAAVPKQAPASVEISKPSKPTLGSLPWDVLKLIGGLVYISKDGIKFHCGRLDPEALSRLALTCSWLNQLVQPVLNSIKVLRENNSIPRLLQSQLTSQDRAFQLLGVSERSFNESLAVPFNEAPPVPFPNVVNAALAVRFWTIPMTQTAHTALVAAINGHSTFTDGQKTILKGLLPNATPTDIRLAANGLQRLGPQYHNKAADFYEKSANHPNATPLQIRFAAAGLGNLGYDDKAAALYELLANRDGATSGDIQKAANGFKALGSEYPEGSAERTEYNNRADALLKKHGLSN